MFGSHNSGVLDFWNTALGLKPGLLARFGEVSANRVHVCAHLEYIGIYHSVGALEFILQEIWTIVIQMGLQNYGIL